MTEARPTEPEPGARTTDRARVDATVAGYELLDAGVRRKLERFEALVIDRPAPGADGFRLAPAAWSQTDLRFDPGPGWSGSDWPAEPWPVEIAGLTMEIRPTDSGGVGLYPEHVANLAWLEAQVAARAAGTGVAAGDAGDAEGTDAGAEAWPQVLNLFAHTGLATLAMARAGAAVAHVDGARSAVAWARRNSALSGLDDRPIRWLVDDAAAFVAREARRGRRYDGIVLDPPAFGRASGRAWRLEDDLLELLASCRAIAAEDAFVLLTAHSEHVDGELLGKLLGAAFRGRAPAVEVVPLELAATSGTRLPLGWAARLGSATRRAS
jgi:23S rRNA (cytosine1962-C5)-methyltransferase